MLVLVLAFGWRSLCLSLPPLLSERQQPEPADAVVVLGGDSSGARVEAAVLLLEVGLVGEKGPLICSGGSVYTDTTWASLMRDQAQAEGVDPQRILLQAESLTTVEDARFSKPLLEERQAKKILLVTSPWHSARAARIFRRELPELEVISVPCEDHYPREWWTSGPATRALATEVLKHLWPGEGS